MVVLHPCPLLPLLSPPFVSAIAPLITLAETRMRVSQAPSSPGPDRVTAVRHLPRVRCQHFQGRNHYFHENIAFRARPALSVDLPRPLLRFLVFRSARRVSDRRSDTATVASVASLRAPPLPATKYHRAMPAAGACASSGAPLSQGTGGRALSAALSATGPRASSTPPPQPCTTQHYDCRS